jgi:hypothetical protein
MPNYRVKSQDDKEEKPLSIQFIHMDQEDQCCPYLLFVDVIQNALCKSNRWPSREVPKFYEIIVCFSRRTTFHFNSI